MNFTEPFPYAYRLNSVTKTKGDTNMKKFLAFILSVVCVAGIFTACTTANNDSAQASDNSAQEEQVPNPIVEFDSAKELAAETKLNVQLPDSVSDVSYSAIIDGEDEPIAQADFLYSDKECLYRMQYAAEMTDTSGVYQEYDKTEEIEITKTSADNASTDGSESTVSNSTESTQKCTLKYTEGEYGIALWYDENTSITYSLSMDNCTAQELKDLVTALV